MRLDKNIDVLKTLMFIGHHQNTHRSYEKNTGHRYFIFSDSCVASRNSQIVILRLIRLGFFLPITAVV